MNATVPDRFLELQRRFLVGLERRLTEMTAELEGSAGTDVLMLMFHSLAGIGGTYGFPRVSEISHDCETVCAAAMEEKRPLSPEETNSLHRAVAEIRTSTR
jgi:chemotaxis protein histidine kinase CheA